MIESARIARGKIEALSGLKANGFDAVIFPGGFGAAKNLFVTLFDIFSLDMCYLLSLMKLNLQKKNVLVVIEFIAIQIIVLKNRT